MFVGRKKELSILEDKYASDQGELIVIYGRRRIGKTALLREFVKDKKHVFYSGQQITDNLQLKRITDILTEKIGVKIYGQTFELWEHVFDYIADHAGDEKTVYILDEFPYMVEANQSIPSVMQSIWDHKLSKKNVMLILCGSSMSFMEKEVLSEKNPLYGRATGNLKIGELSFEESQLFYPKASKEDQIAYYSTFSGVPYYLGFIDASLSLRENVIKNLLSNGSVLFNEVEFLLKQELREVAVYNAIITAIALGRTKQNEIAQLTSLEKTKLPYYINNLIEMGIVEKEYPSTVRAKDRIKARNGLYVLGSSFFRFYYRFVYPYLSELADGNADIIYEEIIEKQMSSFIGLEFEKIALYHIRKNNAAKKLPIRCVKLGRWWKKDVEIDIVGHDVQGNFIFGECKWRNEKVGMDVLKTLQEKSISIPEAKDKFYVLYSKSGFTKSLLDMANIDKSIMLVDATSL